MNDPNVEIIDGVPIGQIHHMHEKIWWKITVGWEYGSFLYWGTEDEAEERRRAKSRWEGAICRKKPATESEIENHLNKPISVRRGTDGYDYSKKK